MALRILTVCVFLRDSRGLKDLATNAKLRRQNPAGRRLRCSCISSGDGVVLQNILKRRTDFLKKIHVDRVS